LVFKLAVKTIPANSSHSLNLSSVRALLKDMFKGVVFNTETTKICFFSWQYGTKMDISPQVSHSLSTHPEHAARMLLLASAVLQTH
jgi:hypothetical protein